MRALTKDLGRLVYKVETEPSIPGNIRRGGPVGGARKTGRPIPPASLDINRPRMPRGRTLSSDEDVDVSEQSTPQQQQPRTSLVERAQAPQRRTNSDDSAIHSATTTSSSSIVNRVLSSFE
jgi:hypothetical protein